MVSAVLSDARIDLQSFQVSAALFALQNPYLKGTLLADQVGLGKTIQAGIVVAQKWAEGKRNIVVVCPATLRHQWKAIYKATYNWLKVQGAENTARR